MTEKRPHILFVSRAADDGSVKPVVMNQALSLQRIGMRVSHFTVTAGGASGYLKAAARLRSLLRRKPFDVVHAHYVTSGITAVLARPGTCVVSLMGSDLHGPPWTRAAMRFLSVYGWDRVIVKSPEMLVRARINNSVVIPNGVDMDRFRPLDREEARRRVGFGPGRHVVFVGDPSRPVKNVELARNAVAALNRSDVGFHEVYGVSNADVVLYMNAADVLLLTSVREGSPNVVKEAMACNLPIVATDVGDVRRVVAGTAGCFVVDATLEDLANGLRRALSHDEPTEGRKNIRWLESQVIAVRIAEVYRDALSKKHVLQATKELSLPSRRRSDLLAPFR